MNAPPPSLVDAQAAATIDFRRRMPLYLLAMWLGVDLAMALFCFAYQPDASPYLSLLLAGQLTVLTGWLIVGEGWIKSTLAVVGLLIVLSALPIPLLGLQGVMPVLVLIGGLLFGLTSCFLLNLPLILATAVGGWRFTFQPLAPTTAERPLQFSLRQFLIYNALLAMLIGIWAATEEVAAPTPSVAGPRRTTPVGRTSFVAGLPVPAHLQQYQFERRLMLAGLLALFPIPWSIWAVTAWVRPIRAAAAALLLAGFWWIILGRVVGLGNLAYLPLIPALVMIVHLQALRAAGFGWRRRYAIESYWGG